MTGGATCQPVLSQSKIMRIKLKTNESSTSLQT
jgi:hypothetical protein